MDVPGPSLGRQRKETHFKARFPHAPCFNVVSCENALTAKNTVYFSSPNPLDMPLCPTLNKGAGGPRIVIALCQSLFFVNPFWGSSTVYFSNTGPLFYTTRVCPL